jgi:hypothetical protein
VTFLVGERQRNEGVFFLGLDSVGLRLFDPVQGSALVFSVRGAGVFRHWFSAETSLLTGVAATLTVDAGYLGAALSKLVGEGHVGLTWTVKRRVSFNLAVTGMSTPSSWGGVTIGSPRLGGRVMPLIDFHLSPVWSLGLDAQVTARASGPSGRCFLSLAAAW